MSVRHTMLLGLEFDRESAFYVLLYHIIVSAHIQLDVFYGDLDHQKNSL